MHLLNPNGNFYFKRVMVIPLLDSIVSSHSITLMIINNGTNLWHQDQSYVYFFAINLSLLDYNDCVVFCFLLTVVI